MKIKSLYLQEAKIYNVDYFQQLQTEIFPYLSDIVVRIIANDESDVCTRCAKRAFFFQVNTCDKLCWNHANTIKLEKTD